MVYLWATTRAAEPPEIAPALDAEGFWAGQILVPAPTARVAALLEDPIASATFGPDISATTYVRKGACDTLHAVTSGSLPVSYDYLRCRTKDGWHETLVSSSTLSDYEVRWRFTPEGAATRVNYGVKIATRFPAPDFLFAHQMKTSITMILGTVYRKATGP